MISAISPSVPFKERVYSISMDFGYTFSGFAISSRSKNASPSSAATRFMSSSKEAGQKEPSCIVYIRENTRWVACAFGMKALEARSRISQSEDYIFISNLKERIDDLGSRATSSSKRKAAALHCDEAKNHLQAGDRPNEPTLLQIISDYLSHLKTAALTECIKSYGSNDFDISQVQWVVSISSSWTHEQKHLIRMAAFEAGITDLPSSDTLIILPDPEAAIMGLRWSGELETSIGNIVSVCDCGASKTVVSTYRIMSGGDSFMPVGKVTTLHVGSESIDRELLSRFQSHVGEEVFEEWMAESPQLALRIDAQFKVLKQFFNMRKKSNETSKKIRIRNQDVTLFTISEAMEIMTNVVDEIADGVENHLKTILSSTPGLSEASMKVIVVGGHARSNALTKKLLSLLEGGADNFIVPRQPSNAILQGLTYLAITPDAIRDRSHRISYGTQFSKLYDPKTDDANAYKWGSPPNQFIASFLPFTKAGISTPPDKVFEQIVCPANDHQTEFPFGLYYSLLSNPKLKECVELVTLTVAIPLGYRELGRENRFRILMEFGVTEVKFSVVHTQSGEVHESVVVL